MILVYCVFLGYDDLGSMLIWGLDFCFVSGLSDACCGFLDLGWCCVCFCLGFVCVFVVLVLVLCFVDLSVFGF